MKEGQICWAWSTNNPDPSIGPCELWGTFSLRDIFLEKTLYDENDPSHFYETKRQAMDAMVSRITELMVRP